MKAVTFSEYGGTEVLQLGDVTRPVPGPGEILIRVEAAEACKSDCEQRAFEFPVQWFTLPLRLALGVRRPRNHALGMYCSGVIEQLGEEVTHWNVGDEVFGGTGLRRGAYGEFLVTKARGAVALKPKSMTHAEAAAVPLGGLTALDAIDRADVVEGDRVLINGAGGVIGAHAVQIAVARGATVTGVDKGIKERFVRSLGASDFVDYTTTDLSDHAGRSEPYNVVFDMVPSSDRSTITELLAPDGCWVLGNPRLSRMLMAPFVSLITNKRMIISFASESRRALSELAAMVDDGRIAPIVDRVLPMDQVADAHRLVETEERIGAIVLAIGVDAETPPLEESGLSPEEAP